MFISGSGCSWVHPFNPWKLWTHCFLPTTPPASPTPGNSTSSSKSGCNTPSSRQSPVPSLQPLLHSFPTRMIQWVQMLLCVLNRVGLWAQGSGLVFTPIISSPSAWALAHSGDGAGPPESMSWGLPGSPVVKNPPSNAGDVDSVPGPGMKIPHAPTQ